MTALMTAPARGAGGGTAGAPHVTTTVGRAGREPRLCATCREPLPRWWSQDTHATCLVAPVSGAEQLHDATFGLGDFDIEDLQPLGDLFDDVDEADEIDDATSTSGSTPEPAGPSVQEHAKDDWRHRARCADGDELGAAGIYEETFFSTHPADVAAARVFCLGCPVLEQCHRAAVTRDERFGVWGGIDRAALTARGRKRERVALGLITEHATSEAGAA